MTLPNLIILYVKDTKASTAFYRRLFGREPAVEAPNFTAFPLDGGFTLGLWAEANVKPDARGSGARSEIAFTLDGKGAVAAKYEQWKADGYDIEQPLTTMDFGPTFVINDIDGHRIRVCEPDK
ncbi:drug:proton antiporter [Metarhizobium album]|uniref:Drug:proton antiporter n=1 Tax=Metarhizobium album TaxID=2182425 RepID=A0A2U2DSV3_9HYPH|nr:VOC family protein [Rhizobium album]PWE56289.1 drug:proton antiporter [Rhizobium album]